MARLLDKTCEPHRTTRFGSLKPEHNSTKLLVKKILENPQNYEWSLQGLGMLRLYLSQEVRLHVWHNAFRIPHVSSIHDHPWDFKSYIVAGVIRQQRYVEVEQGEDRFKYSILKCGAGNCSLSRPKKIFLKARSIENYSEGYSYNQLSEEIHDSMPVNGTVTIVTRHFRKSDLDHARVFWPEGTKWVSAEPRPATNDEVDKMTSFALGRWF